MQDNLIRMARHAAITAFTSPALAAGWLALTEQGLLESPVALTSLVVGVSIIADRAIQSLRVKNYAQLSAICDSNGPTDSVQTNKEVRQILAGKDPKVKFTYAGLQISGLLGDETKPSQFVQETLSRIRDMKRVPIPDCVLNPNADELANLATARWYARITFPLSILNLILIAAKDPKDRRPDDYIVIASSTYNIYDYLSGPSVDEARGKFTEYLKDCKSSEEVLRKLIALKSLKGGMSFLGEWAKDVKVTGVRVGRSGTIILYLDRQSSIGGPYPIQQFPKSQEK